MTRKKSGLSQRSLSVISLFYLLYLIATRENEATHQNLCELTGLSYPTLHRNLRLLREGCGVDIRSKRQADNTTFFYIESWGNKSYVANSGLIVAHAFRGIGLAILV